MNSPVTLVTKRDKTAQDVRDKLLELAKFAEDEDMLGMATVLIRKDGGSWVCTIGRGNRVQMLGAVTDLQFTIAKDGDGR